MNEFDLTQECLARMLGIRGASVAHAASALRKEHLIRYSRGHITILDRKGLDAHPVCVLPRSMPRARACSVRWGRGSRAPLT
ncbi:MAG: helix-turn-helix domain-containing protein [Acidiferrobacteraceae bacterium]